MQHTTQPQAVMHNSCLLNNTMLEFNGDNKERLFEIIEQVWSENKHLLGDRAIFFERSNQCTKINQSECSVVEELASNHEEADTKVVYLLQHAIEMEPEPMNSVFVVRSSSGDVDIPVILLANDFPAGTAMFLIVGMTSIGKISRSVIASFQI